MITAKNGGKNDMDLFKIYNIVSKKEPVGLVNWL